MASLDNMEVIPGLSGKIVRCPVVSCSRLLALVLCGVFGTLSAQLPAGAPGGRPPPTNGRRPRGPLGGGGPQPPTGRLRPGGCGPPPTNGRRVFRVSRAPLVWVLQSSARACKPIYCERQTRPDGRKRPPPGVFVALPFLPDDDCSGLTQKTQKSAKSNDRARKVQRSH